MNVENGEVCTMQWLARSHEMPTKVTMVEVVNPIANSIITLRSDPKAIAAMK